MFPLTISTSEMPTGRQDVTIIRATQGQQDRIGGVSFTVQRKYLNEKNYFVV